MIRLHNIMKSYPVAEEDLVVLKEIDLHIKDGEFVAIMGPSGSGKSTLMNIIGCLDKPTSGEYLLNGKQVSGYDDKELARVRNQSVGFVFQQFQLLPRLNAVQNVELPMIYAGIGKSERMERAEEALEKVGLGDRMEHFPNELSGGQKQRVAIARAIVNEPNLILADEPTGALDTKTGVQIMEMFTLLNKEGTTVILVTHEAEVASYANRTVFVRDGRLTTAEKIVDQEILERIVSTEEHLHEESEAEQKTHTEIDADDAKGDSNNEVADAKHVSQKDVEDEKHSSRKNEKDAKNGSEKATDVEGSVH